MPTTQVLKQTSKTLSLPLRGKDIKLDTNTRKTNNARGGHQYMHIKCNKNTRQAAKWGATTPEQQPRATIVNTQSDSNTPNIPRTPKTTKSHYD